MEHKEVFGFIGVTFSAGVCVDYIVSTLRNKTKPHTFTWIIWGLVTGIVAVAQWGQGAAAGSWPAISSAFWCGAIALLSFFKGERNITLSDWVFFVSGLLIIPFWHATHSALLAVILATLIDACAYIPTIRKSWIRPEEEKIFMYASDNVRWVCALLASSDFSVTTLIYPIFCLVANNGLALMIFWRRKIRQQNISASL